MNAQLSWTRGAERLTLAPGDFPLLPPPLVALRYGYPRVVRARIAATEQAEKGVKHPLQAASLLESHTSELICVIVSVLSALLAETSFCLRLCLPFRLCICLRVGV